jgi:hypothetical protein
VSPATRGGYAAGGTTVSGLPSPPSSVAIDSLGPALRDYLIGTMYTMPAQERRSAHWVMSAEWFYECRKLADVLPPPGTPGDQLVMYGLPVEIRDGAGAPQLEGKTGW